MFVPPQFLTVGPLTIYFYSLFILLGIILGFLLARPEAKRFGLAAEELALSIFYALIPGFIGARLYHVIDQWSVYSAHPLQILETWNGGLGILGGLAGGLLGLWFFWWSRWGTGRATAWWRGRLSVAVTSARQAASADALPFLRLLDIYVPSVLLAQAIGRFGNWTNQEAFGPPTDVPWRIYIAPENRPDQYVASSYFHPTFFYEAGFDFVGLAIVLLLRPRLRHRPGAVLGAYLVIYGLGRFIVEFYRFGTAHVAGIAVAHVVAVVLVFAGSWLLVRESR